MASINKIQNALVSATQETTLALANLSFDFSLVRVEAPIEYKGVGAALSHKRRHTAENGPIHVTARRLGSLFESILPDTPDLVRAYGRRASDISASPSMNPKTAKAYGPFQEYVGVDGTSIWAAATSSSCAVAVHLLACMLARLWPPSESISIWEELIAEQRTELAKATNTGLSPLKNAVASLLDISREQICEWDASARAWLLAADGVDVTKTKQRQVMLILENINIPVNNRIQVYGSVTQTWKTALTTMDRVIGGTAYNVQDGAVLAALAAWHLYPDIVVLGGKTVDVRQHDELINPGGVLTVGLQTDSKKSIKGLSWSLSLAHLRYYGYPVLKQRSIGSESSRLSTDDLLQVALGCVLGSWGVSIADLVEAAATLSLLCKCVAAGTPQTQSPTLPPELKNSKEVPESDRASWVRMLGRSAMRFLSSDGKERESCRRLVLLGLRKCKLLTTVKRQVDVFGLTGAMLISLMKNQECQKTFLRDIIGRKKWRPDACVIRLALKPRRADSRGRQLWQYVTAIPDQVESSTKYRYARWIPESELFVKRKAPAADELYETYEEKDIDFPWDEDGHRQRRFEWSHYPSFFLPRTSSQVQDQPPTARSTAQSAVAAANAAAAVAKRMNQAPIGFRYLVGDLDEAAIFHRTDIPIAKDLRVEDVRWSDIKQYLEKGIISPRRLYQHMSGLGQRNSPLVFSLRTLEKLYELYDNLPGATISPRLLTSDLTLGDTSWAIDSVGETPWPTTSLAFACIAMCETGILDLEPGELESVIAVSSGDSLFIASRLVQDPAQPVQGHGVKRVVGNIGRAGLALLIPPPKSKLPVQNPESWKMINHASFDGKLEDCFPSTSLHLGFSGYEFPLWVKNHGDRFTEAFFIESVISVHDRGRWIADIDVQSAIESPLLRLLPTEGCCKVKPPSTTPGFYLTSIDQWEELLDQPGQHAIVRAHHNWQARLAAAVISVKLGNKTLVFAGDPCWKCGPKALATVIGKRVPFESTDVFIL